MDLLDKIIQRHHQLEGSRPATGREGMLNTLKQKVSASAKQHALSLTDFTSVKEPASDIEVPDPLRFSGMTNAYANAAYLMKAKMRKDEPQRFDLLKKATKQDIIVVPGSFDHIEQVFDASFTPYTVVNSDKLASGLSTNQIVFVNCPGDVGDKARNEFVKFVMKGGYLVTTDWAIGSIIQKSFPGFVKHSGGSTSNECVDMHVVDPNNPYTYGVIEKGVKPVWWLEGSSYPIKILDKGKVEVLMRSNGLGSKYHNDPVGVVFGQDKGKVFHFISHFYLQKSEGRGTKASKNAGSFASEALGLEGSEASAVQSQLTTMSLSDAESAYTSARLIHNIIIEKMRENHHVKGDKNG